MEQLKVMPPKLRHMIDTDAKLFTNLKNSLTRSIKDEKDLLKNRNTFATEIKGLSSLENNPNMTNIYNEISAGLITVSGSHGTYVDQIENKVLPVMAAYQPKAKEMKSAISKADSKQISLMKSQTSYNVAQSNPNPSKRESAEKTLQKAKGEYEKESQNLTTKLKDYQYGRMSDLKQILLHTINAEMSYHAKALEKLSDLAHKVYNIDDRKEAEIMINDIIQMPQGQGQGRGGQMQSQAQPRSQLQSSQQLPQQLPLVNSQSSWRPASQVPGPLQSQLNPQSQMAQGQSQINSQVPSNVPGQLQSQVSSQQAQMQSQVNAQQAQLQSQVNAQQAQLQNQAQSQINANVPPQLQSQIQQNPQLQSQLKPIGQSSVPPQYQSQAQGKP